MPASWSALIATVSKWKGKEIHHFWISVSTSHLQNKSRNHDICMTDFSILSESTPVKTSASLLCVMNFGVGFRSHARQWNSSQDHVSQRMFIFQASDMQFATYVVRKQKIFRVFVLLEFYLNDVSVITIFWLQSTVRV